MSKVICSNCGAEVILPETSKLVTGMTISKQGCGVHYLPMEKKENNMGIIENSINNVTVNNTENKENKSMTDLRATELSNNGINTNKYFSFKLPNGKTITVDEDGNQVTDEIMSKIENDGFIDNKTLYRRWVMAQFFRMYNFGLNEACKHFTQGYMWKMLDDEIKTLAKLEKKDSEYFAERSHFFAKDVVFGICNDYITALRINIDRLPVRYCTLTDSNGKAEKIPYKKIWGENFFVSQIDKKFISKYQKALYRISFAKNYEQLYKEFKKFKSLVHYLPRRIPNAISPTWLDAYKGAGAYYTLQNMVLYHHCKLLKYENCNSLEKKNGEYLTGNNAYKFMQDNLGYYENYQWVGMFKKCVEDNNFSFGSKPNYFYK